MTSGMINHIFQDSFDFVDFLIGQRKADKVMGQYDDILTELKRARGKLERAQRAYKIMGIVSNSENNGIILDIFRPHQTILEAYATILDKLRDLLAWREDANSEEYSSERGYKDLQTAKKAIDKARDAYKRSLSC